MNPFCPRHRPKRSSASARQASESPEQCEWAGLPVNLELTFSTRQRDRVYREHLRRTRPPSTADTGYDTDEQCHCKRESA